MKSGYHLLFCCWSQLSLFQAIRITFMYDVADEIKEILQEIETNGEFPEKIDKSKEETLDIIENKLNVEKENIPDKLEELQEELEPFRFHPTLGLIKVRDEQPNQFRGNMIEPKVDPSTEVYELKSRLIGSIGKKLKYLKIYTNIQNPSVSYSLKRKNVIEGKNIFVGVFDTEAPKPYPSIEERLGDAFAHYLKQERPRIFSRFDDFTNSQRNKFWNNCREKDWLQPWSAIALTCFLGDSKEELSVYGKSFRRESLIDLTIKAEEIGLMDVLGETFPNLEAEMNRKLCKMVNEIAK